MQTRKPLPLNQSRLYKLSSPAKLAGILGSSEESLNRLIAREDTYNEFDIDKKDGGKRHVENPVPVLKVIQAKIAKYLSAIDPPDFLFCPVKGRSYISNAAAHRGNRVVHCLDIKKFFPSVPSRRVYWFFHKVMKCRSDVSSILTNLLTLRGRLPTGSPHSPILAYFAYYDLWSKMSKFCVERNYTLTVYIDDVTVSGLKIPESDLWVLKQLIHGYGLRYHKEKTFIDRPAEITGVIVDGDKLAVPHRQHLKRHLTQKELRRTSDTRALRGRLTGIEGQIKQITKHNRD